MNWLDIDVSCLQRGSDRVVQNDGELSQIGLCQGQARVNGHGIADESGTRGGVLCLTYNDAIVATTCDANQSFDVFQE